MKTILSSLAIITLSVVAYAAPEIGSKAPDFSVTDTNGKIETLSQYKGKYVVLEWTNPDCPFVHKHYDSGNMQKLQKEFTGKGVIWLTINSSADGKQGNYTPDEWNKIVKDRNAAPTAVLLDKGGVVGKAYEAKTTPDMYIINPEGNLIYEGGIDNIKSPNPADIPKATNYVQAALDEAMAGKPVTTSVSQPYGCGIKY
ncbi:MAG: thioredoxin family protein [Chthoniobacteraceae bacterium]